MVENPTPSFAVLTTGLYAFPWRCALPFTKSSIHSRFTLTPWPSSYDYSRCSDDRSPFLGRRATQCFSAKEKSVDATPNHVFYDNSTKNDFIFETASQVVEHFLSPAPVIPASNSNDIIHSSELSMTIIRCHLIGSVKCLHHCTAYLK